MGEGRTKWRALADMTGGLYLTQPVNAFPGLPHDLLKGPEMTRAGLGSSRLSSN